MEIKNAIIKSTTLGIEDHGIMTFYLGLNYGCIYQSAGGYSLDTPIKKDGVFLKRIGTAFGMCLIIEVLRVVGANDWENLKGKHIRVKADSTSVYAIGNIITDDWLDFKTFYENIKESIALIEEE